MTRLLINVKYSLYTWKNHFFKSSFLLIQTVVGMFIISYVFTSFFQYLDVVKRINGYIANGNIYKIEEYDYEVELSDDDLIEYSKIFNEIKKNKVKKMIMSNTNSFANGEEELPTLQVDDNFFDTYNVLLGMHSKSPKELFFLHSGDVYEQDIIPVYMGYKYKKKYHLGEKVNLGDIKVRIEGFLKPNQSMVLPMQGPENISVDDYIFLPYYVDEKDVDDVKALIENFFFVTDDKKNLDSITDAFHKAKNNTYFYKNYKVQFEAVKRDYNEMLLQDGIVGAILIVFSIMSILGMVFNIVEENEYAYGVSMICGASKKDIYVRVLFHELLIFILAFLLSFFVFGTTKAILLVFVLVSILVVILCIYAFKIINVESIIKKIKGKE